MFYLYIKTHNKTGLKYLGQTTHNPYEYKGSGKYWKAHIKKHGNNVTTEIVGAFDNKDDLKVAGLFWSQQWNIIESNDWANLTLENGKGGNNRYRPYTEEEKNKCRIRMMGNNHKLGKKHTKEFCELQSKLKTGRKLSLETRKAISNAKKGIPRSEETRKLISEKHKAYWAKKKMVA